MKLQENKTNLFEDLNLLWSYTKSSNQIKIAVLDGIPNLAHPCFKKDALTISNINDDSGLNGGSIHGTSVTSVLFSSHQSGIKGIVPNAKGLIIPIYKLVHGKAVSSQEILAKAIVRAVHMGAHIINISGGEIQTLNTINVQLEKAVAYCKSKKVLIIAAAGNHGCQCMQVPAAIPSVLAVGVCDEKRVPYPFSNFGMGYKNNGILIPVSNIKIAINGENYSYSSSTSMATPVITGVIALFLDLQLKHRQNPDPLKIKEVLLATAENCDPNEFDTCERHLRGIINIKKAYELLFNKKLEKSLSPGSYKLDHLDHPYRK